jgi:hypothetical protein
MVKIIERVQAHYESRVMPFGKTYEWLQPTSFLSAAAARGGPLTLRAS